MLVQLHAAGFAHRNVCSITLASEHGSEGPWKLTCWDNVCEHGERGPSPPANYHCAPEILSQFGSGDTCSVADISEDIYSMSFSLFEALTKESGHGNLSADKVLALVA